MYGYNECYQGLFSFFYFVTKQQCTSRREIFLSISGLTIEREDKIVRTNYRIRCEILIWYKSIFVIYIILFVLDYRIEYLLYIYMYVYLYVSYPGRRYGCLLPDSKITSLSMIQRAAKYSWSLRKRAAREWSFIVTSRACSNTRSGM